MRITKKMIDRLAGLDEQIAVLMVQKKLIETELKARGPGIYVGLKAEVEVAISTTCTLDPKLVKGVLTPAQLVECTRYGVRTRVVIRELYDRPILRVA